MLRDGAMPTRMTAQSIMRPPIAPSLLHRIASAVASACAFLEWQQAENGRSRDHALPVGPSDQWVTAVAGLALADVLFPWPPRPGTDAEIPAVFAPRIIDSYVHRLAAHHFDGTNREPSSTRGKRVIDLELKLTQATDLGLSAVGEIYQQPLASNLLPLVSEVIARTDRSARFQLAEGVYEYQFAIDLGEGPFVLSLHVAGSLLAVAARQFSTEDGFDGRVFRFVVQI
jgi:hypothetical protein